MTNIHFGYKLKFGDMGGILTEIKNEIDDLQGQIDNIESITAGLSYKGVFDASAEDFSAIVDPKVGWFYKVSVAGSISGIDFEIGDMVIVNKDVTGSPIIDDIDKIDNTESADLLKRTDIDDITIGLGEDDKLYLKDGISATKIGNGDVDNNELSQLNGCTINIQSKFDSIDASLNTIDLTLIDLQSQIGNIPEAQLYTAGDGLLLTGNRFDINTDDSSLEVVEGTSAEASVVPQMTSATSPSGLVFGDMVGDSGYELYRLCDKSNSSFYSSASAGTFPHFYGYKSDAQFKPSTIKLTARSDNGNTQAPKSGKIQASNDTTNGSDGTWVDIQTFSGLTFAEGETKDIVVNATDEYYACRIYIESTNYIDASIGLAEFDILGTVSSNSVIRVKDGGIGNDKLASNLDVAKLADGSISNTEFQHLNGVTSNIQDQLNAMPIVQKLTLDPMIELDEVTLDIPDLAVFDVYEVIDGETQKRVVGGYADTALCHFSAKQISSTQVKLRKNLDDVNTNVIVKIFKGS